jgi:hypothetical protein
MLASEGQRTVSPKVIVRLGIHKISSFLLRLLG